MNPPESSNAANAHTSSPPVCSSELSAANRRGSGCYRCGKPVRKFGGIVSPSIRRVFGPMTLGTARWWTDCGDCGYVEVREASYA